MTTNAQDLKGYLGELLDAAAQGDADELYLDTETVEALADAEVRDYSEAGVLSGEAGLVVRLADGSEYQVTVVKSR